MKKLGLFFILVTFLLLTGCDDNRLCVKYEDKIYYQSDKMIDLDTDSLIKLGTIESATKDFKKPEKNNEANSSVLIGKNIYQNSDNSIIIDYDGYTLFEAK